MASSITPNNISTGFNQGDFNLKIKEWINNPNNVDNPATVLLNCFPNNNYINSEYQNIKLNLSQILLESNVFESKRIQAETKSLLEQIQAIECIGEDSTYLFGGFVEHSKQFIERYNLIKSTIPLESDVNQNPNYYNS